MLRLIGLVFMALAFSLGLVGCECAELPTGEVVCIDPQAVASGHGVEYSYTCMDAMDNDGDGKTDYDDPDCRGIVCDDNGTDESCDDGDSATVDSCNHASWRCMHEICGGQESTDELCDDNDPTTVGTCDHASMQCIYSVVTAN